MRFGVEIEFGGSRAAALTGLREAGLAVDHSDHGYLGNDDRYWVTKSDGSVSRGGEAVSPPLEFTDPDARAQVTRAVEALAAAGCVTDGSAGIHVHIESRSFTAQNLSDLARTFAHFEDAIYRIATSGWTSMRPGGWGYAAPLSEAQKRGLAAAKDETAIRRAYYGSSNPFQSGHGDSARYCGLNLHSHFYRGTVEFRVFNSSLNPMRVQTYIALCHALMQDALSGRKRSLNRAMRLGSMRSGTLDEAKALNGILSFRYQAGMSLEDYQNIKRLWADSRPQGR